MSTAPTITAVAAPRNPARPSRTRSPQSDAFLICGSPKFIRIFSQKMCVLNQTCLLRVSLLTATKWTENELCVSRIYQFAFTTHIQSQIKKIQVFTKTTVQQAQHNNIRSVTLSGG